MSRRAARILARLALIFLTVALLAAGTTARFLMWPQSGHPDRADAVVVLSGDHGERLPKGLNLIASGVSSTLVLDGQPDLVKVLELCGTPQAFEVVCLRPKPDNTRAEARALESLAESRGWRRVIVVTTTHHATRAGLLFRRCFNGEVSVVTASPPYGWGTSTRAIVHEVFGLGYALVLSRGC